MTCAARRRHRRRRLRRPRRVRALARAGLCRCAAWCARCRSATAARPDMLPVGDLTHDHRRRAARTRCAARDTVVHLAGRAHVMRETAADPLPRSAPSMSTRPNALARAAAAAGAAHFVFASSVKVNGEATLPGRPFRESDPPDPHDDYAREQMGGRARARRCRARHRHAGDRPAPAVALRARRRRQLRAPGRRRRARHSAAARQHRQPAQPARRRQFRAARWTRCSTRSGAAAPAPPRPISRRCRAGVHAGPGARDRRGAGRRRRGSCRCRLRCCASPARAWAGRAARRAARRIRSKSTPAHFARRSAGSRRARWRTNCRTWRARGARPRAPL